MLVAVLRRPALSMVFLLSVFLSACGTEEDSPIDSASESSTRANSPSPTASPIAEPSPSPETVSVPDLVGLQLANARGRVRSADLRINVSKKASTENPGTVLSQRPLPGSSRSPGGTVRLTVAKPKPEPPPASCDYSPCLPPAADYDCAGGSGDGPEYTGSVRVIGSDIYGLDADGDGYGCE